MSCKTRFFIPLAAALMLGIGSPGSALATSSGIDTPPTVGDLPFAINGAMVMDMNLVTPPGGLTIDGPNSATTADTFLMVGLAAAHPGIPANWGGIHTWDLYANGSIGLGQGGGLTTTINSTGISTNGVTASGQITGGTMMAGAYFHSSDARLKTAIHPIPHALDKILALQGVQFNWKKNGHADMGVVAQNVASVFPDVVTKQSDGMMAVEYDSLVGPMIEAIRELDAKNKALEAKLAVMQDRLDHMPATVAAH